MPRPRLALIALLGTLALLVGALAGRSAPPTEARLLFTGDILLSRQVAVEMNATGDSPWKGLEARFAQADWVGGNLEGAIGPASDCRVAPGQLCFAFPDFTPQLLAHAGFRGVTLANNHAADLGDAGRARTVDALRSAGVLGVDFAHSPRFVRLGEVTMAIVAIDLVPGADGAVERLPSTAVAQRLRLARTLAEVVVVSVHWGQELNEWPSGEQRRDAEWLVKQGADLIVGHHPHVVQPPECLHGRPVFFSLGNHVFDQRDPVTKFGLIADCTIDRKDLRCGALRTTTRHGSSVPVLVDSIPPIPACSVPLGHPFVVNGYRIRPAPWSPAAPQDGATLEGWKDGKRAWVTRRVSLVSLQRGANGKDGEPLVVTLERHPSPMDGVVGLRPHVYAVGEHGLIARWRGTALAWPLLDAVVEPTGTLCALHRGDSFLRPDPTTSSRRTMEYRWNGFGFSATNSPDGNAACASEMRRIAAPTQPAS